MSYRPQFVFAPTPAGFRDEEFIHAYTALNVPALGATIAPGETLWNIPLPLETDARFIWRAILLRMHVTLTVQFREPSGILLSSGQALSLRWQSQNTQGGAQIVPIEPEIECPPGGVFILNIGNPSAAPRAINGTVTLFGVKRYDH